MLPELKVRITEVTKNLIEVKVKEDKMSNKKQELPDAYLHQKISFIKSAIRIVGYLLIPFTLVGATVVLVASELVGIVEELV